MPWQSIQNRVTEWSVPRGGVKRAHVYSRNGGSRVVAMGVPWYSKEPDIEEGMTEEEAAEPFKVRDVLRYRCRKCAA